VTVPLAWRLMIWTGAAVKNIFLAGVAIITTLAAGPVRAADMRAAPLPPPVTAYNWTGWYAGVNGGAAFGRSQSVDVLETFNGASFFSGNFGTLKAHGPFGGGQIGYNWQTGPFVLGIETDIQAADISDTQSVTIAPYLFAPNSISVTTNSKLDWFGTVRGRVGVAWDRLLIYATGGYAYGGLKYGLEMSETFGASAANNLSFTRGGYAAGAGAEYAFAPNWSGKFEYQYLNLGSATITAQEFNNGPIPFAVTTSTNFQYHTFRLGLNYHFGAQVAGGY
jgi:outer membrane immunogenic protein